MSELQSLACAITISDIDSYLTYCKPKTTQILLTPRCPQHHFYLPKQGAPVLAEQAASTSCAGRSVPHPTLVFYHTKVGIQVNTSQ